MKNEEREAFNEEAYKVADTFKIRTHQKKDFLTYLLLWRYLPCLTVFAFLYFSIFIMFLYHNFIFLCFYIRISLGFH